MVRDRRRETRRWRLDKEFGYFTLKELESIKLPFGLTIERDIYFEPTKLNELN